MASGTAVCKTRLFSGEVATVSRPRPPRKAARAANTAAPAFPGVPAANRPCPKHPLWANRSRGRYQAATSSASVTATANGKPAESCPSILSATGRKAFNSFQNVNIFIIKSFLYCPSLCQALIYGDSPKPQPRPRLFYATRFFPCIQLTPDTQHFNNVK